MTTNAGKTGNARMIHHYLEYLHEAHRRSKQTIALIAASIDDFESVAGKQDFKRFKPAWAIKYKEYLSTRDSKVRAGSLASSTIVARLSHVRSFFLWLSERPGYKSRIRRMDCDYFNPTFQEGRAATSRPRRTVPSLPQVHHLIRCMPHATEIQQRDRALVAFIILTGARADAAASFRVGNVNLEARTAFFDGRTMRTKNRKGYTADFFPVGDEIEDIIRQWLHYLVEQKLFGPRDPLFPATQTTQGNEKVYEACGLSRDYWKSSEPVRRVFKLAWEASKQPYYQPHSLRTTLGLLGQRVCATLEEHKAWSQNLGHESLDTTLRNYGHVGEERQLELMSGIRMRSTGKDHSA